MKESEYRHLSGRPDVCACTGPRPGEPLCPCEMTRVKIIDGRYVHVRDLGPVAPQDDVPVSHIGEWDE